MNGWSVPLLGTSKPPYIPPAAGGGNVKVFYFTDVHLDLTYKVKFKSLHISKCLKSYAL